MKGPHEKDEEIAEVDYYQRMVTADADQGGNMAKGSTLRRF